PVRAGSSSVTQTVTTQVHPDTNNQPAQFVEPLGYGTTLDLTRVKCLDLHVMVQDPSATRVDITQTAPVIDGATLTPDGDFGAQWHWCPSAAQIAGAGVYTLLLGASDGATKTYRIVLKRPSCSSGTAPTVTSA